MGSSVAGTVYYQRRIRSESRLSAHPRMEFWVTLVVLVAVIAAVAVFLLVYHDVPFRPGGSAV